MLRSTLPLVLSCLAVFAGLGVLAYGRSTSTYEPTPENTRLVYAKEGSNVYWRPALYNVGVGLVTCGMVSTMITAWLWGRRLDERRRSRN